MKLPLHIKLDRRETPQSAHMKYQMWFEAMSKRPNGHGFRVPVGQGSKRIKPRHGHGIPLHEGGLFMYLNTLQFVMKHGGYDARQV